MTEETLIKFKKRAKEFSDLYNSLTDLWNGKLEHGCNATYPVTIVIEVIIHNIAFNGSNCVGYSHEEDIQNIKDNLEVLRKLDEYENKNYMTHYPYSELSLLYEGLELSEVLE